VSIPSQNGSVKSYFEKDRFFKKKKKKSNRYFLHLLIPKLFSKKTSDKILVGLKILSKNRKTPRIWTRESSTIPAFFSLFFRRSANPLHMNPQLWVGLQLSS
jgi:hypothetical protein